MKLVCLCVCNKTFYIGKCHAELVSVSGEVVNRECGVVIIKTGVKNCYNHSCSVILERGTVEDTRFVNVNLVFYKLCFAGIVFVANNYVGAVTERFAKSLKLACLDHHFKSTKDRLVVGARGVVDVLIIEGGKEFALFGKDLIGNKTCLGGISVFRKGKFLVPCLVSIQQGSLLNTNDYRNVVGILYRVGELIHYRAINKLTEVLVDIQAGQFNDRIGDLLRGILDQEARRRNHHNKCQQHCHRGTYFLHPFVSFRHLFFLPFVFSYHVE